MLFVIIFIAVRIRLWSRFGDHESSDSLRCSDSLVGYDAAVVPGPKKLVTTVAWGNLETLGNGCRAFEANRPRPHARHKAIKSREQQRFACCKRLVDVRNFAERSFVIGATAAPMYRVSAGYWVKANIDSANLANLEAPTRLRWVRQLPRSTRTKSVICHSPFGGRGLQSASRKTAAISESGAKGGVGGSKASDGGKGQSTTRRKVNYESGV